MNAVSKTCIAAVLLAAVNLVPCLLAQNYTARLDLEQSTDGLSSWQRVPITSGMLNNGSVDLSVISSSAFYRLKVEVVQPPTPIPTPTTNLISVTGGTLSAGSGLAGQTVATFQIAKYEVTWGEWREVRDWAVANGYSDLAGVGGTYPAGAADNFPVCNLNWYEIAKWSNARSEKEGLTPVYQVSGETYKTGVSDIITNSAANGYRLPTEAEWEWAASGGLSSQGYTYSGSNDVNAVAWYESNIGSYGAKAVGTKAANELGIHDMSGNVWEWCWDTYYATGYEYGGGTYPYAARRIRGGSYDYHAGLCTVAYRGYKGATPSFRAKFFGFRLARNSP